MKYKENDHPIGDGDKESIAMEITIRKPSRKLLKPTKSSKYPRFFLNTGSRLLNLALSGDAWEGGWAGQRVVNVIGDTTTGKTLLACEAVNQLYYDWHKNRGKKVKCTYRDVEAAFDFSLAENFGMPLKWIDWNSPRTIQQYFNRIYRNIPRADEYDLHLDILDSLDGISEDAEIARAKKLAEGKELKGTYGTQKAREMSAGLRLVAQDIKEKNMIIFIVSQVREDINNVSRVKRFKRSSGKALDHNASQIVWLAEIEPITKSIKVKGDYRKEKIGKRVRVRVSKNRLYREGAIVDIDILDRHGIDDIGTMINWLDQWGALKKEKDSYIFGGHKCGKPKFISLLENDFKLYTKLVDLTQRTWDKVEAQLKPDRRKKYQ